MLSGTSTSRLSLSWSSRNASIIQAATVCIETPASLHAATKRSRHGKNNSEWWSHRVVVVDMGV